MPKIQRRWISTIKRNPSRILIRIPWGKNHLTFLWTFSEMNRNLSNRSKVRNSWAIIGEFRLRFQNSRLSMKCPKRQIKIRKYQIKIVSVSVYWWFLWNNFTGKLSPVQPRRNTRGQLGYVPTYFWQIHQPYFNYSGVNYQICLLHN